MAGEIKAGMSYGSYDALTKELSKKHIESRNASPEKDGLENESTYKLKNNGKIVGNAFREQIRSNNNGMSLFSNAVVFIDGYEYGTSSRTRENLDKFDYIQAESKYAIDLNNNGIVDKNEIFKGKLDRTAYKKAKDDGDLNKYKEYTKEYSYYWSM